MEKQRTQVTLSGIQKEYVLYINADRGSGLQVEAGTPHEIPIGTILRMQVTVIEDVRMADGNGLPIAKYLALAATPAEFLRGRLVTPSQTYGLDLPPEMVELMSLPGVTVIGCPRQNVPIVDVLRADGSKTEFLFPAGSIAPPADASPYAVGESPEELAASLEARVLAGAGMGAVGDEDLDDDDFDDISYAEEVAETPDTNVRMVSDVPETSDPEPNQETGGEGGN